MARMWERACTRQSDQGCSHSFCEIQQMSWVTENMELRTEFAEGQKRNERGWNSRTKPEGSVPWGSAVQAPALRRIAAVCSVSIEGRAID